MLGPVEELDRSERWLLQILRELVVIYVICCWPATGRLLQILQGCYMLVVSKGLARQIVIDLYHRLRTSIVNISVSHL